MLPRKKPTFEEIEAASARQGPLLAAVVRARLKRQNRRRVIAATAAMAAVAGISAWQFSGHGPVALPAARESNAVVLAPERRLLPEGSVVELRRGAHIAVDFAGSLRRVVLNRGEANFKVAKDRSRPFVVEADGIEVRAVGTAFDVRMDSGMVAVLVTEGRVAVTVEGGKPPVAVDAGFCLQARRGAQPIPALRVPTGEMAQRLDWREPQIEFAGVRLADAVALMNRYNSTRLEVDDPDLANQLISGRFRVDHEDVFLRLIERSCDIEAERSGEALKLRKLRRAR
jgi:transmembrane sensor